MYKMCPSNEVKTASFGGNLSYWVYLFVQIQLIVLLCNRFVSNLSTRWSVPTLFSPLPSILFSPIKAAISRLSKKLKFVAVGGHAPTTATPPGKFCDKLCARSIATSARFAVKFCRRLQSRAPPAADTARRSRGSGRRAQARLCAHRAMRTPQPGDSKGGNSRGRRRRARLLPPLQRVEFLDTLLRFQRHLQNRQGYVVPEKVTVSYLCVTSRTAPPNPARASGTNPWSSQ